MADFHGHPAYRPANRPAHRPSWLSCTPEPDRSTKSRHQFQNPAMSGLGTIPTQVVTGSEPITGCYLMSWWFGLSFGVFGAWFEA